LIEPEHGAWQLAAKALVAALGAGLIGSLGAASGGYYPATWGWASIALLWVAAAALIVGAAFPRRPLDLAFLGGLLGLAAWIALSAAWSIAIPLTVLELERVIVYLACILAVLLVVSRRTVPAFLAGLLAGITGLCAYALVTRLFPDRLEDLRPQGGYQLSAPFGYWNSLGIVATIGCLLALGFAARGPSPLRRALAGSALLLLVPTIYFTFSRGAWLALIVGVVASLALADDRPSLAAGYLIASVGPVVAVVLASSFDGLTERTATFAVASRDGHRLAVWLVVLAVASAGVVYAVARFERPAWVPAGARNALVVGAALGLAALAVVAIFRADGLPSPDRALDAFDAPAVAPAEGDLNARLFSFSGSSRADYWHVAWSGYRDRPLLGSGAGTFERVWLRERPGPLPVRDAHNLYLETLSELGPIGGGFLLAALGAPVIAAFNARRSRVAPAVFGAYAAYLSHAAVDWDWEMPAVTATALGCGAVLLVSMRAGEIAAVRPAVRVGAVMATLLLAGFSFVALIGNSALDASAEAIAEGRRAEAETEARKAARWAPWSSEPWLREGEAKLAQGDLTGARTSFRRAVNRDPGNWLAWHLLALASVGPDREEALDRAQLLNPLGSASAPAGTG
jgi:O-antigen ligase